MSVTILLYLLLPYISTVTFLIFSLGNMLNNRETSDRTEWKNYKGISLVSISDKVYKTLQIEKLKEITEMYMG